jgi:cell division protein FtsL
MTPPPATAAANGHRSRTLRRGTAPRAPRRVSGPTRPPRAALAGGGAAVARPPLGMRLGHRAMRIGDARVLDRLVRGRAWIAIVAAALIGIVFMQVSMLKLNAGVSRAVTAADTLERQNATLRAEISKLGSGERVQDAAAKQGMVTPAAGDVHYLNAEGVSAARAAASIKAPNPLALAPAAATTPSGTAAATMSGATATGAATTGTGAAATAAATNGATATGAAATGTTAQNGAAAAQQTPTTQQQASTAQNGAATANGATSTPTTQQTAPPATGTTSQAGSVAGGATATTPGEG